MTQIAEHGRRPRNRRQLILAAAATRFRTTGYHNVGITDIADAVGITSAALYRHFDSKQGLLEATVRDAIEHLRGALADQAGDLDAMLRAACRIPTRGHGVGVLWSREMVHLSDPTQHELRNDVVAAVAPLRTALGERRADLGADEVDLVLWAIVGVIAGSGYHAVRIPAAQFEDRLLDACRSVAGVPVRPGSCLGSEPPARRGSTLLPASRPEAILTAAARLFGTRGYPAVSVDDIGTEAGITGATVYHHFPNKAAILAATLNRCLQAMLFDLSAALDRADSATEALDHLLGLFVRTCVEHGHVVGALQKEAINLPPDQREALFLSEREYREEWVALLRSHRRELPNADAELLVRATLSSIGGLMAVPSVRHRPELATDLAAVGRAILGIPGQRPTEPEGLRS